MRMLKPVVAHKAKQKLFALLVSPASKSTWIMWVENMQINVNKLQQYPRHIAEKYKMREILGVNPFRNGFPAY